MEITHLIINSAVSAISESGGGLAVEDRDGKTISLSAERDDEGKGVLRVVDSAPHGFDEEQNLFRVVDFSNKQGNFNVIKTAKNVEVEAQNYYFFVERSTQVDSEFTHFTLSINASHPNFRLLLKFDSESTTSADTRRRMVYSAESLKQIDVPIQPDEIHEQTFVLPKMPFLGSVFEVRFLNETATPLTIGEVQMIGHRGE